MIIIFEEKKQNWIEFHDFSHEHAVTLKKTEFRFESPMSILEWNDHSDFGRKSENYFKLKVFSESRPQSAQKLIWKSFSDF